MILPIADFSFANRNVCCLYPCLFMSTYEEVRRLQPLVGCVDIQTNYNRGVFLLQFLYFYDLLFVNTLLPPKFYVTNERTGDVVSGINNNSRVSRNPQFHIR
jgi:hypothetical protein